MTGLLLVGVVAVVIALYLAERFLKARAQARRLHEMNDRLTAATARVERAAGAETGQGKGRRGADQRHAGHQPAAAEPARGRDARPGPVQAIARAVWHGRAQDGPAVPRGGRTGDHQVRPSERHGA